MQDSNKSFKDGWDKIYQKRLVNESALPQDAEDDGDEQMSPAEQVQHIKHSIKKLEIQRNSLKISVGAEQETFDNFLRNHLRGTRNAGEHLLPIHSFKEAWVVFKAPDSEKDKLIRKIDPKAPLGSDFNYRVFINDYRERYNQVRDAGAPQGAIAQKPSDPGYRKPNTVYQQPQIIKYVGDNGIGIMTVILAGAEHLAELQQDPTLQEIFKDPIVGMFMSVKQKIDKAHEDYAKLTSEIEKRQKNIDQILGQKKHTLATQAPAEPSSPAEPRIANESGPGKVMQTVVVEKTETVEDVVNRNRKVLNENWAKYKEKNKDAKNNEKPDDLTLLMG